MVKGQMKIQQTAFMLMALTLFFVLIGLAFLGFGLGGLKNDANLLNAKQAKLLVSKLSDSPEFSCGDSFGQRKTNCVDEDKVLILMQNASRYKNFWGVDDIKIRKISPDYGDVVCDFNNYPECGVFNILEEGVVGTYESNFISLCRKEKSGNDFYNKCELARLMVSYKKIE